MAQISAYLSYSYLSVSNVKMLQISFLLRLQGPSQRDNLLNFDTLLHFFLRLLRKVLFGMFDVRTLELLHRLCYDFGKVFGYSRSEIGL